MSYIFYCSDKTMDECFQKALFGNTYRHWETVKKIRKGDPIFLINLNTGTLYGPFFALRLMRKIGSPFLIFFTVSQCL